MINTTFKYTVLGLCFIFLNLTSQVNAWWWISPPAPELPAYKDKYADHFLVGSHMDFSEFYDARAKEWYTTHSSIVTANPFYWSAIQNPNGSYNWSFADDLMTWVATQEVEVRGHPLLFGSVDPDWVFQENGNPISREALIERMRNHIQTIMTRYKGEIQYWDVVNEPTGDPFFSLGMEASAITDVYKKVPWYNIIGEEYVELALRFAHEADPDAKLFVNENNLIGPISLTKKQNFISIIKNLLEKGAPIHGVGIQGHFSADYPPVGVGLVCDTIKTFTNMGLEVHITELDMSIYSISQWVVPELIPSRNQFGLLSESRQRARYTNLFRELRSCSDHIGAVLTWGILDENSWLRFEPKERNDWPLLFHKNYEPKQVFRDIMNF